MPVLLGHPHLLLREALQLIAITERITSNINKAGLSFSLKDNCYVIKKDKFI